MAESSGVRFVDTATLYERDAHEAKGKHSGVSTEALERTESSSVNVEDRDFRKKQVFKGWTLFWLAYQSIGTVYGDIGTSPLYVYSSTFTGPPTSADLLGALSLIIWSLTLIVTIKYVCIVLCADDEGEGGTFAVYSLLSRYSNIAKRDPRATPNLKIERHSTTDLQPTTAGIRSVLENSKAANAILKGLSILGVSLIMADGILTPAQSVLGAIQGLKVATPDIDNGTVIGVSCAILVVLFLFQPLGVSKLANVFAPVIVLWLLFNAVFGIYNLAMHDASVLKAFSPYYAGDWFVRNKTQGWINLGGILLAFTGVEALFADLGAFSKRAIQLSWLFFCYPCLLLAYIGQAAYIMDDPASYDNPFFNTVPPGLFYPSLVLSVLAAIVASQAIITSVFQLLSQLMTLSFFPHIKMIHPSSAVHGQVYIPLANWIMMVGTVIVTAVYSNTTRLGHAYGFCVILVTFITTCMVSLVALIVWRTHPIIVLLIFIPFVTFDGLYLSSAFTKLPDGAWFTLLLAIILSSFFILWRFGKEAQWTVESHDRYSMNRLIVSNPGAEATETLHPSVGGGEISRIKGLGIFFDKQGQGVPPAFSQFVLKFQTRPDVYIFLHMRALSIPSVPEDEKYAISALRSVPQGYRVVIRHGYNDQVISEELGNIVYRQVRAYVIRSSKAFKSHAPNEPASNQGTIENPSDAKRFASEDNLTIELAEMPLSAIDTQGDPETSLRVAALDRAYVMQTVYIVGKEELRILHGKDLGTWRNGSWWSDLVGRAAFRRLTLGIFLWLRENTRTKVASMRIPIDKLVEVGFVKNM